MFFNCRGEDVEEKSKHRLTTSVDGLLGWCIHEKKLVKFGGLKEEGCHTNQLRLVVYLSIYKVSRTSKLSVSRRISEASTVCKA